MSLSTVSATLLTTTGLVHCGVGLSIPKLRDPFLRIIANGTTQVKDNIGERYQRECAFWFQFAGLMMISQGYLLRDYCAATRVHRNGLVGT